MEMAEEVKMEQGQESIARDNTKQPGQDPGTGGYHEGNHTAGWPGGHQQEIFEPVRVRYPSKDHIYGYDLLLPDHSAEHGHFEPVPWQYGDLHTNYPDLTVHDLEAQFVLSILGTNHATLVMDINWIKLGQGQKMQEQSLPTISRGNGGQSP